MRRIPGCTILSGSTNEAVQNWSIGKPAAAIFMEGNMSETYLGCKKANNIQDSGRTPNIGLIIMVPRIELTLPV